mgnify:FL=1
MIDKLKEIIEKYNNLAEQLSQQDIISNMALYKKLSQEYSGLKEKVEISQIYINKNKELDDVNLLIETETDSEMKALAIEEQIELKNEILKLDDTIKDLLIEADPDDHKNTILEIRSGTGGSEASLFADNLFRMYLRYAEQKNWKAELMNLSENEGGGVKEAIFLLKGTNVYADMKYESGVHRVQRVPETESSGRIHTSAATVAVLPEVETIDVEINEIDIKIDTYRASGAGGQHVNKTESAIRITHLPSGLVVTCQDQSSQHKNKDQAMKVLRARLYDIQREEQNKQRSDVRKTMVSTGDRSAKIRTYNFPQGRVTDHRINLTLYKLTEIMNGDLTELIQTLKVEDNKNKLASS